MQIMKEPDRTKPTWENQVWHAERLLADKGERALENPHAMTGRICGCGSCFCCAALYVLKKHRERDGKAVQS